MPEVQVTIPAKSHIKIEVLQVVRFDDEGRLYYAQAVIYKVLAVISYLEKKAGCLLIKALHKAC